MKTANVDEVLGLVISYHPVLLALLQTHPNKPAMLAALKEHATLSQAAWALSDLAPKSKEHAREALAALVSMYEQQIAEDRE